MEKKKSGSKEVRMEVARAKEALYDKQEHPQKLSYEELNKACADMSQQLQQQNVYIQQMRQQMEQMRYSLMSKRMEYLFKAVEISSSVSPTSEYPSFDKHFVEKCIDEIQNALTEEEEPRENNKGN